MPVVAAHRLPVAALPAWDTELAHEVGHSLTVATLPVAVRSAPIRIFRIGTEASARLGSDRRLKSAKGPFPAELAGINGGSRFAKPRNFNRGGRIRTGDLLLPNRSNRDANLGRKSRKSNWDCTICASCRWGMSGSAGLKKPKNRVKWRAFGGSPMVEIGLLLIGTSASNLVPVAERSHASPDFSQGGGFGCGMKD